LIIALSILHCHFCRHAVPRAIAFYSFDTATPPRQITPYYGCHGFSSLADAFQVCFRRRHDTPPPFRYSIRQLIIDVYAIAAIAGLAPAAAIISLSLLPPPFRWFIIIFIIRHCHYFHFHARIIFDTPLFSLLRHYLAISSFRH
jgi:hypothetical protein